MCANEETLLSLIFYSVSLNNVTCWYHFKLPAGVSRRICKVSCWAIGGNLISCCPGNSFLRSKSMCEKTEGQSVWNPWITFRDCASRMVGFVTSVEKERNVTLLTSYWPFLLSPLNAKLHIYSIQITNNLRILDPPNASKGCMANTTPLKSKLPPFRGRRFAVRAMRFLQRRSRFL